MACVQPFLLQKLLEVYLVFSVRLIEPHVEFTRMVLPSSSSSRGDRGHRGPAHAELPEVLGPAQLGRQHGPRGDLRRGEGHRGGLHQAHRRSC